MEEGKGRVFVSGGTGYLGSWLIFKLLQHGYSVNTSIRSSPDSKKDVSYLTNLPGASQRLQIFSADLAKPESFNDAIEGCIGVFHVAHPIDVLGKETEEEITQKSIDGTIGILQACLNAKTVKRFVYTSSVATVMLDNRGLNIVDENILFGIYTITKTLAEKACLEFGEKHGLDIVTLIPPWISGPFICTNLPRSVRTILALILGHEEEYQNLSKASIVHIDDLAEAHIFLFENPHAKGRYICSAVEITTEKLTEFLSARYPQYQIPSLNSLKDIHGMKSPSFSSKKLLDAGFKYKYSLEEIYDGAIKCCKEKGFL
ncbi:hypothetical protein M9H77_33370 [Catharanthus roseus]|uniref:Uncharacterized protein n=1 Tax=Catharanthus roseus TaxID=4058 RepID=A0ACB9ZLQ3_CATRO|nr:hypothetical protein M9H77_33370 [Catharanthus roseus]